LISLHTEHPPPPKLYFVILCLLLCDLSGCFVYPDWHNYLFYFHFTCIDDRSLCFILEDEFSKVKQKYEILFSVVLRIWCSTLIHTVYTVKWKIQPFSTRWQRNVATQNIWT